MVEPVDPFECGKLDGFEVAPRPAPMNDFGLVKPVNRFCESIVVAVADTSDRGLYTRFGQSLRIPDRHVLNTPVGMMYETAAVNWSSIMKRLFQGIEDKGGMRRPADTPADNTPGKCVDDEGDIDKTLPGGHVREIRNPDPVRCRCLELAVHTVERVGGQLVRKRRLDRLATDDPLKPHDLHEPCDGAAGNVEALPLQLPPDLAHAIDPEVLLKDTAYLDLQNDIAASAG